MTRIRVPPLRERVIDIEPLVQHFNRSLAERHGIVGRSFGAEVMDLLGAYAWPGNVRELRNVVERLLLTSDEAEVQRDELPEELLAAVGRGVPGALAIGAPLTVTVKASAPAVAVAVAVATSIEDAERAAIIGAVKCMHCNLTQAARALGVLRSTLFRKVKRYRLESLVAGPGGATEHPARALIVSKGQSHDLRLN